MKKLSITFSLLMFALMAFGNPLKFEPRNPMMPGGGGSGGNGVDVRHSVFYQGSQVCVAGPGFGCN